MSAIDKKKTSRYSKEIDYARYGNCQIKKISEFEFLIENADIDIERNIELIGGEYGLKQQRQKQFRMRVPVRILANDILVSHMLSDRTLGQAMNRISVRRCNNI